MLFDILYSKISKVSRYVYSDKNQLHYGSIVCMLGARYKSYCSNLVRTMMVDPTEAMQKDYDLLLRVQEHICNKLQHGECLFVAASSELP